VHQKDLDKQHIDLQNQSGDQANHKDIQAKFMKNAIFLMK